MYVLSVLELHLLVEGSAVLPIEAQHLVHLSVLTELSHILWSHDMTVEVTPYEELALHVLIGIVGTVVCLGRDMNIAAADRTLTDGGVEKDTAVFLQTKHGREWLSSL